MPEPVTDTPSPPHLTPQRRVAQWEPLLAEHGWTVRIIYTDLRARLEADHPSGAAVMVTAGIAGRTAKGRTHLYVLKPVDGGAPSWLGVKADGMEEFIRSRVVSGHRRRVESKCRCRSGARRPKARYATESRAGEAMGAAQRQRARAGEERAECRTYRCPDDDRVWHVSSRPSWRKAPGESALWDSP